jgi:aryl-alcohol dehydrogenase-like predicted oxidoreductase
MATGLRKAFRNARGTRNVAVNLSPGFIRASVETSLKRLRTDYLDVLALHNVSLEDLAHPVIQETLSELVSSGKVRYLATAGSSEAALAALSYPGLYSIVQLADNPAAQPLRAIRLASSSPIGIVTHSVFGLGGQREFFTKVIEKTPHLRATLQAAGYGGAAGKIASDLLLDRALASNAEGVVLMSMFAREHLASNVARASRPVNPEVIHLAELVTGATELLDSK